MARLSLDDIENILRNDDSAKYDQWFYPQITELTYEMGQFNVTAKHIFKQSLTITEFIDDYLLDLEEWDIPSKPTDTPKLEYPSRNTREAGTAFHKWIELQLNNEKEGIFSGVNHNPEIYLACIAWKKWREEFRNKVQTVEITICDINVRMGGRVNAIFKGENDNEIIIIDWMRGTQNQTSRLKVSLRLNIQKYILEKYFKSKVVKMYWWNYDSNTNRSYFEEIKYVPFVKYVLSVIAFYQHGREENLSKDDIFSI